MATHDDDAINVAIVNVGTANQTQDKLLRFYQANGATAGDIKGAERQFLLARVGPPSDRNLDDMWEQYLRVTKGFTGSVDDMKARYWESGPRP